LYARQDAAHGANISIKYGAENNVEAMNNTILANQVITNGNYQKLSANFSMPSNGVYYIGILAEVLYAPYYLSIDDISINIAPSCVEPENFNLSLIGDTWAKVKWDSPFEFTPDSYDIYYSQSNIQPDDLTNPTENIAGTNISYDIENLETSSNYYVWIRSNCGAGNYSEWIGPVSFSTNCIVQTLPILEDFESAEVPQLPNCTNVQSVGNSGTWTVVENSNTNFQTKTLKYQHNGNTANAWFYTRGFNLEAETNYVLRFRYGKDSEQAENIRVAFGNSTDQTSMISTIALLQNFEDEENIIIANFSTASSGIYYIGFNCFSNATDYGAVFIDDIHIDQAPICAMPLQMTVSNVGAYSASIAWPLNLAAYEIEWGPSMFEIGTGQRATVYNNSFQITNLMYGTEYDVYLRQICASGEYSPWSTKRIFTTTCPTNSLQLPYYEDFEGMFCYSILDVDGDGYSWSMNVTYNHTENGYVSYMHDSFFQEQEGLLVSHLLQIPENRTAELSFWSKLDYANSYDENTVLISTDGFNSIADSIWSDQNPSEEWTKIILELLDYGGQDINIGFRYKGYFAHKWWIDDIAVELVDDAKLNPGILVYDLENPLNLSTNIIWNNAQSLVSLVDNQIEPYTLVQGIDYELIDNSISILLPYLMQVLHNDGDDIEINLNFDNSSAILKIIATGFPVFVDASISPNSVEYDLSTPADVNTIIEWNDASEILSITDNQASSYTLNENTDYSLEGNLLTISSSYLQTVLQHNGDILELSITFNHGFEVFTIEATGEILIFDASINPNYLEFGLENPQNLNTTITWNSATEIISITDNQNPNYNLQIANDYFLNGNILTISEAYLSSALTQVGDIIILNIFFDYGVEQLNIEAVGEAQPIDASINPNYLEFDLDNPESLNTTIIWNDASEIISITDNFVPSNNLQTPLDYSVNENILTVNEAYLSNVLQEIGEIIILDIVFDYGAEQLSIEAIGEVQYVGASINPDSVLFNILYPENISTNIAWNDATEILTIINLESADYHLIEHQDYLLDDSNLSILSDYISPFLHNIGDEINLQINFDYGKANLNITATSDSFISIGEFSLKVYPNPSKGKFIIDANQELEMQITDISGRKVYEKHLQIGQNTIDITNQAAGIYLISFINSNFVKTLQISIE
ncbi:MAG: T9SS type A sorting domain-containing protein, partial [Bacteroidales bacterium]|nr:T9SS type A sorting domain-containing protein [Bacteroidales bacterium]